MWLAQYHRAMKYPGYHLERPERHLAKQIDRYDNSEQKTRIWNDFIDSELTEITEDDFSVVPRVLPQSYFKTIARSSKLVTEFCLRLMSLPEKEVKAIIPPGPVADHLLHHLEVLKHRTGRITGSFRFDMAIVGEPDDDHPPYLLEINEIGFDGLARSSFFQKTLLENMPDLRKRFRSLDTAAAEIRNMQRLGNRIARLQYDTYNWDEEYLLRTAKRLGADVRLVCPNQFGLHFEKDEFPLLERRAITFGTDSRAKIGDFTPDAINMSFAYELEDYKKGDSLYRKMMQSKTPQYGPFLAGLVASKTILVLLDDAVLRKRLMGSRAKELARSVLPARLLSSDESKDMLQRPQDWVVKHCDGFGGQQVFMDKELERCVSKVKPQQRHEWVLQKKTRLNLIEVNGILSKPKRAIADLGVFVEYDWSKDGFTHFEVGGLMSRATNKSLKVNVSSGGLQVAVLLDRKS